MEFLCINTMLQGGKKSKVISLLTHSGSSALSPLRMSLIGGVNNHFKIPALNGGPIRIWSEQSATESPLKYEIFSGVCVGHFTCRAGLRCALMKPLVPRVMEVTAPRKRCLSEAAETFWRSPIGRLPGQDACGGRLPALPPYHSAAGSDIVLEHISCATDHIGHNGGGWQQRDLRHTGSVCSRYWQWRYYLHIF